MSIRVYRKLPKRKRQTVNTEVAEQRRDENLLTRVWVTGRNREHNRHSKRGPRCRAGIWNLGNATCPAHHHESACTCDTIYEFSIFTSFWCSTPCTPFEFGIQWRLQGLGSPGVARGRGGLSESRGFHLLPHSKEQHFSVLGSVTVLGCMRRKSVKNGIYLRIL